jgi:undecaprenyl diphosphate synthase
MSQCFINSHFTVQIPKHIAIVMDGNGRWAKKRFLPRVAGHHQGIEALRRVTSACLSKDVSVLTVFAFSSENWNRPTEEVSGLLNLFSLALSREVRSLHEKGVRLFFIGKKDKLSLSTIDALNDAERITKENKKMTLNICFDYGGRWDICQAINSLIASKKEVSEEELNKHLSMSYVPDPDLVIRTGGEMRISNFLLWQMAYSELFFTPVLWPDADEELIYTAIDYYTKRERRFGRVIE